jgi:hypothetical protein
VFCVLFDATQFRSILSNKQTNKYKSLVCLFIYFICFLIRINPLLIIIEGPMQFLQMTAFQSTTGVGFQSVLLAVGSCVFGGRMIVLVGYL